jgi:hypothetical protein
MGRLSNAACHWPGVSRDPVSVPRCRLLSSGLAGVLATVAPAVRALPLPEVGGRHDGRMDDAKAKPRLLARVATVQPGTARFDMVLNLATQVLGQDRHLSRGNRSRAPALETLRSATARGARLPRGASVGRPGQRPPLARPGVRRRQPEVVRLIAHGRHADRRAPVSTRAHCRCAVGRSPVYGFLP